MADYDLLGSFSTGGAKNLNADLINKLKEAEKKSVLSTIDRQLENITGVDADTGDKLDDINGESDIFTQLKVQTLDLMTKASVFDLGSGQTNAFDIVSASTTGEAAIFDAVDIGGLEEGTNNITISQLAQREVHQSVSFNGTLKDTGMSAVDQSTLAAMQSAKISIQTIDSSLTGKAISKSVVNTDTISGSITIGGTTFTNDGVTAGQTTYQDLVNQIDADPAFSASIGTDGRIVISNEPDSTTAIAITGDTFGLELDGFNYKTHDFDLITDQTVTNLADVTVKSVSQLAAEINATDEFIASIENVGPDQYKLVIKSTDSGQNNSMKISQTNMDLGLNDEAKSKAVTSTDVKAGSITINGTTFTNDGVTPGQTTYEDLRAQIDADPNFTATFEDGKLVIKNLDGLSTIEVTNDTFSLDFGASSQTQKAQNLKANVDGIDYNIDSNTLTIQGNLTMTAVKVGDATINIKKDNTQILNSLNALIESYNTLVQQVTDATGADSTLSDQSTIRGMLNDIKEKIFKSYGENGDLNLFNYGLAIDIEGKLSLDSTKFAKALTDNYDDIKDLLLGNTTDADLAQTDSTKFVGLGAELQDYLDDLDTLNTGTLSRYEDSITERKKNLEEERKESIEKLDAKYQSMSAQFAQYASVISQFESSFSGLKLMIDQSVSSS